MRSERGENGHERDTHDTAHGFCHMSSSINSTSRATNTATLQHNTGRVSKHDSSAHPASCASSVLVCLVCRCVNPRRKDFKIYMSKLLEHSAALDTVRGCTVVSHQSLQ